LGTCPAHSGLGPPTAKGAPLSSVPAQACR